jgi:predicted transcriptional regulator of viral defense system
MPTFSHISKSRIPLLERLSVLADQLKVFRASELKKHRIHRQALRRALDQGLVRSLDRGLYAGKHTALGLEEQIVLACKRVPHGVICLESALQFRRLIPSNSDSVCIAISRKARKPTLNRLHLRFVRFSGKSLTGGVVNTRIHGVPVRVYSVAKTIADCFKYRRKIGIETAVEAFRAGVELNKCSRERVLHFADICRVGVPLRAMYRFECTGAQITRKLERKLSRRHLHT